MCVFAIFAHYRPRLVHRVVCRIHPTVDSVATEHSMDVSTSITAEDDVVIDDLIVRDSPTTKRTRVR
jgi:hypothetical protein